ncbi:MAG TPA: hypothetical protein V6D23_11190, partial [Candidatus Obscuribacterales bacterium]
MNNTTAKPLFPNYTEIPSPLPLNVWHALRVLSVLAALGTCLLLFLAPMIGLMLFWKIVVPLLPLVFLTMPGLWRNVCPLAAMNQVPRLFGFTKNWVLTPKMKEYYYVLGFELFFWLVLFRRMLFNENGPASALLILGALTFAFIGGTMFKGKSGWCSSICPLLPVQRLYGQTPFVTIPNSHCQPCVGCTKNCYDFNPTVAYLADQYDNDRYYTGYRRLFAATFPGFICAYFLLPYNPPEDNIWTMFVKYSLFMFI